MADIKTSFDSLGDTFDSEYKNKLNGNFSDAALNDLAIYNRISELISKVPQPSEIVDARGPFNVLSARLNTVDAELEQKATKEDLNELGQLKVEGVYSTLSALQSAFPTGRTGLFLVQADGFTYRWNGSSWVQVAQFQSTGIAKESITTDKLANNSLIPQKTNYIFIDPRNLYNYETNIDGIRFATNGSTVNDANFSSSDFIKVEAGTVIRIGNPKGSKPFILERVPFYDNNQTFVSIISAGSSFSPVDSRYIDVTIPSAGYIRISVTASKKHQFVVAKTTDYDVNRYQEFKFIMDDKVSTKPKKDSVDSDILKNGAVTNTKTDFLTQSKNIFNKEQVIENTFFASAVETTPLADYFVDKEFRYVETGDIHINKCRQWFLYDLNGNSYDGANTGNNNAPVTLNIEEPSYLKISGHMSNLDSTQIEYGTAETSYVAYTNYFEGLTLTPKQISQVISELPETFGDVKVTKNGGSYILESDFGETGEKIKIRTEKYGSLNESFNLIDTTINTSVIHTNSDDITPIRAMNTTLGANHGFTSILVITMAGHGKTTVDLGSRWSDGVTQYTLLKISGNILTFGCPYGISDGVVTTARIAPVSDLLHVSGATNTGPVSTTSVATGQLYPSVNAVSVKYLLDGKEINDDGVYYGDQLQVIESYNVMDYKSLIDLAQNNIGTPFDQLNIEAAVKLSNIFTFTKGLNCSTSHSMKILKKLNLGNCGFVQSAVMSLVGHTVKRFLPNVLPKSGIDLAAGYDITNYNTTLLYTDSDLVDPEVPPAHFIDWLIDGSNNRKYGFTMGYIIDKTNSKNVDRLANAATYWDMRSTKKVYPTAIGNVTVNPGDYFNFQAFRNYVDPEGVGVADNLTVVKDSKDTYLYADLISNSSDIEKGFPLSIGKAIDVLQNNTLIIKNDIVDAEGVVLEGQGNAIIKLS